MADRQNIPPDFPLPPANFAFLVESILMQTQMQLGLLRFDEKDENEPNLPLARHSIDMLSMLQEKTRGNLTTEEQRLIENGLTELRFRFVQVSEELQKKPESALAPEKKSEPPDHHSRRRQGNEDLIDARSLRARLDTGARFRHQRGRANDRLPLQSVQLGRPAR